MNKSVILLISVFAMFVSCVPKTSKQTTMLELFKVALPENFDTTNLLKLGADRYFKFEIGTDSVLIKSYEPIDERTGEPNYPNRLNIKYNHSTLSLIDKENLQFSVNYFSQLQGAKLPNNIIDSKWLGCNFFGTWIAVLTDANNHSYYYSFINHNLPPQLYELCNSSLGYVVENDSIQTSSQIAKVNTDSLVSYITHYHLVDIKFERPPPLKSTVKFTPPPYSTK